MNWISLFFSSFLLFSLQAQEPLKWSGKVEDKGNGNYELIFTATIEKGWTTYSQFINEGGPVPTSFTFSEGKHYKLLGKAEESGNMKTLNDKVFNMKVTKFFEKAIFTQKVTATATDKPVEGYLTFMVCNDKECLPPTDVNFKADFKNKTLYIEGGDNAVSSLPGNTTITTSAPASSGSDIAGTIKVTDMGEDKPVEWKAKAVKTGDKTYDLVFEVAIKKGWYVYSQKNPEDGPLPTEFTFEEGGYQKNGEVKESDNVKEVLDKVFGMKVRKFNEKATFTQSVTVTDPTKPIKGYGTFQTCDDTKCIKADFDFEFPIGGASTTTTTTNDANVQGSFDSKRAIDPKSPVLNCGTSSQESDSYLWVFLMGLIGGFLALLTPCVFPMVPLTVSFFTKSSKDKKSGLRNAIWYGLSIIIIYISIAIILTSIFGVTILNEMSTDMYFNMLFFIVFIFFAGSFFGYYEITLPSSWINKSDKAAEQGGLIGIFFMAFTLSLVSFSCTGPLIGTLLVQTVQNATDMLFGFIPLKPLVGMFGFSLALAIPFALFAAFPSWLNSLPRSGSWMNNVKVTLGFLELALALKFFSTADMVRHWEIMKYELFIGLWIVIFAGLALYQFGIIRFPHDSPVKKLGYGRITTGILATAFVIYMCSGFYRPLSLLSGLAPPIHYSWFGPKGCPHGLECYHDFDEGVARAKELGKPVFVDFTGYGCVNCRKMEENIWIKKDILKYLREDYVVVSLYVDDQKRLFPENNQHYLVDKNNGQKLRTLGSKWASFQINNFGISSQPYYVLMHNDGTTVLNPPVGYTPDESEYKSFLQCGVDAFKKVSTK